MMKALSEDDVDMFATSSTDENAPIGKSESIDIIVRGRHLKCWEEN